MSKHHSNTGQLLISEAEFHECLVWFFTPFLSTRPMDLTCFRKSVTHFAPIFKFKELLDLYFDYIYGLFEDFRITDRAVTASYIRKYGRFKLHDYGFPQLEFQYPENKRDPNVVPPFEYWKSSQSVEELLSRTFLYQDSTAVPRILRYTAPAYILTTDLHSYIMHVLYKIRDDLHRCDVVECNEFNIFSFNERDDWLLGYRRLMLILMVLDFVLHVRLFNSHGAIKRLRLLFQTINDPYVTWSEIIGFVTRRFPFPPSESRLLYTKSFQESCTECFPECLKEFKPRSLKHLARCKVRRCLGVALTLPHGVWGLRLPSQLEDYVLLQSRKDQFRPIVRPLSRERVFDLGAAVPKIPYVDPTVRKPKTTCYNNNIILYRGPAVSSPCPHSHFANSNGMAAATHCQPRPHHCDLCGKGFSTKKGLTSHIRRIHAGR